ncbi:CinA family protein [Chryseobacterium sp. 09-1422]|jgi:nicotinamide-nucleotide amidase|uniref:CinA family protein n=1 Tax=Chryseobacterium kimseyorum TaxID=2984028 RepID=A0ABT3I2R5_9FLAO|nr:CinA family protein [Chryseobacterium kimseyorum]MCW3170359.1 CinA family protein [Chryseobacterium kimseyorum]
MILKPTKIDLTKEQLSAKSFINFIVELQNLLEYIGTELSSIHETVSIAESVTAGFLQFSFSQMTDASQFFKGGITAYTVTEKINVLKIDEGKTPASDGVSPEIAESMALNVANIFKSDWSIAVTGYANPIKKSRNKLFAYFSISHNGKIILTEKLDLHSRTMSLKAQLYYSEFVLGCFKLELDKYKMYCAETLDQSRISS